MKNIYNHLHDQPDRLRRPSFPSEVHSGGLHDGCCPLRPREVTVQPLSQWVHPEVTLRGSQDTEVQPLTALSSVVSGHATLLGPSCRLVIALDFFQTGVTYLQGGKSGSWKPLR